MASRLVHVSYQSNLIETLMESVACGSKLEFCTMEVQLFSHFRTIYALSWSEMADADSTGGSPPAEL
jgi:hypothetical protein